MIVLLASIDSFLSSRIMTDLFYGLADGVIYALVALSLVIIWQSTHVLNFAQGAMATFATFVGMTQLDRGLNWWVCFAIAILFGFLFGGFTERVLIRPLYGKPEINPIVVMVGLLGLLEAIGQTFWSSSTRNYPAPFSQDYWQLHGHLVALSAWVIFEFFLAIVIMVSILILFQYTNVGLRLRAAALAPEVARLLGVRVNRMLTLGWMVASAVGTIAAIIVTAGTGGLNVNVMDAFFVSGFIAAAIGGLDSPVGAVIGGIVLGVTTAFVRDFWSGNAAQLTPLVALLVVLMIRPEGLFSKSTARRV